jgi:hypothetical protein
MRIRSTKPEFWRSERIASVSWETRLVLKGLESFVDDNGVGKDDLALIVADVFPRDLSRNPPGTLQKVSEALSDLSQAGLIWRYEVDGTRLLYISFWERIQRIEKPSKGRMPRPDGTFDYRASEIGASFPEPSGSTPVGLRPGTGEQGNRGTGISSSEIADAIPDAESGREDVERLCERLADRIEANGAKRPTITKGWRDAARLLIDKDGRTEEQVAWIIDWATADEFWRANILSMPKLREKFDQLLLKARLQAVPTRPAEDPNAWMRRSL